MPKLFSDTVARWDGERWWVMNHPEKGFASFGYWFWTLKEIEVEFNVDIGEESADRFGRYVPLKRRGDRSRSNA